MNERIFSIDLVAGAGLDVLDAQEGPFMTLESTETDDADTQGLLPDADQVTFDPFKGS